MSHNNDEAVTAKEVEAVRAFAQGVRQVAKEAGLSAPRMSLDELVYMVRRMPDEVILDRIRAGRTEGPSEPLADVLDMNSRSRGPKLCEEPENDGAG